MYGKIKTMITIQKLIKPVLQKKVYESTTKEYLGEFSTVLLCYCELFKTI